MKKKCFLLLSALFLMMQTTYAQVRFETEGDAKINGRLGIGTINPSFPLEVNGSEGTFRVHPTFESTSTSLIATLDGFTKGAQMRFESTAPDFMDIGLNGTGDFVIEYDDNETFILNRERKVGIRRAPTAPLTVEALPNEANAQRNGIHLFNPVNEQDEHAIIQARVAGADAGNPIISMDIFGVTGWSIGVDNNDDNKLKFTNDESSLSFSNRMSLTTDGKLFIGSGTATERLDVDGKVRIRDVPNGSGDMLMIDGSGVIVRQAPPVRIADLTIDPIFKAQKELLAAKDEEIKALTERLDKLEQIVQQLAAVSNKIPPSNTQISVLTAAQLAQNVPNPFNQSTTIRYTIPTNIRQAVLNVTDINGKLIKSIPITNKGTGETILQTESLGSGQYFYTLILDGVKTETKKMILNR